MPERGAERSWSRATNADNRNSDDFSEEMRRSDATEAGLCAPRIKFAHKFSSKENR